MDLGRILCFRSVEKRSDVRGSLLYPAQPAQDCSLHLRGSCDDLAAKNVVLQIVPDQFVGIQFWRVRRQEEQPQSGRDGFDERSDHRRLVRGMPVYDQEDGTTTTMDQPFQVLDEDFRRNTPSDDRKVKLPCSTHGGNQVHPKPCSSRRNDRSLATGRPGGSGMCVRPDTSLVAKKHQCFAVFCVLANARILFFQPSRHSIGVLLVCSPQRPLRTQTELIHQSAYRRTTQLYAKLSPDNDFHHVQCPQRKQETHLQRILGSHRPVNPRHLLPVQFPWAPPALSSVQRIPSTGSIHGQPTEHRGSAHPHRLCNLVRRMSVLNTSHAASSKVRQRLSAQSPRILFHAREYRLSRASCPYYYGNVSNVEHVVLSTVLLMGCLIILAP